MQSTCTRSASRPILGASFFNSTFSTPTTLSRSGASTIRYRFQSQLNQRQFHSSPSSTILTSITARQACRIAPTSTRVSFQPQRRYESTSASANSTISQPPATAPALAWNDFFRLRQRRRYINLASSLLTASGTFLTGVGVVAAQDLESLQVFGLDPLIASGIVCLVCAAGGWLAGPLLGGLVFRLFVGRTREIGAKERDFYSRIRRYRVDPSNSSVQNPVPDYYGEKITSVKGYRQWLKDQKAFRRKRESLM